VVDQVDVQHDPVALASPRECHLTEVDGGRCGMDVGPSKFNTRQGIEYYKEDSNIQINCPELLGLIVTYYVLTYCCLSPMDHSLFIEQHELTTMDITLGIIDNRTLSSRSAGL